MLKKTILNGIFHTAIEQFSTQIIVFFVNIILARLLAPEEFGLIAILNVITGIASVLINSGMNKSLIRSEKIFQSDFSTTFYFNFLSSIILYFFVLIIAPFVANYYGDNQIKILLSVFSLTIIIQSIGSIQLVKLTKDLNFKAQLKISFISVLVGGIVSILLANMKYGVWSMVYGTLIQNTLSTLFLWNYTNWIPSLIFDFKSLKKHWNFGKFLLFSSLLETFYNSIYFIIIGKQFSVAEVGYFQRADSIKQFPVSNISNIISKVTFPVFSSFQNNTEKLKFGYREVMRITFFVITPLMLILVVLAKPFIVFLLTEKWLPAVKYFQILCLNGILYPIHSYNLSILNLKGRSDLFFKLELVKKIIQAIVIIYSLKWGMEGLLYSTVLNSFLSFFINSYFTGKIILYGVYSQILDMLPIFSISIAASIFLYFFDKFIFLDSDIFLRLSFGVLFGVLIYSLLSLVFMKNFVFEIYKRYIIK